MQRHLQDLEQAENNDFDYYFDEDRALKITKLACIFPHVMGTLSGQPFKYQPWQLFFIAMLYGWRKKTNGLRRFRKIYLKTAKKNGKTEFAATLGNLELFLNDKKLSQTFWAATKREQAKIGWERQKLQLEILGKQSKTFKKRFDLIYNKIHDKKTHSFVKALGRDSRTEDGIACKVGIIDEFHEHPNSDLLKQLETSSGNWQEPLFLIITTAGFNIQSPCAMFEHDVCKPMLEGKIEYDSLFCMMFELDEKDDWQNEENWYKANPNLGQHSGASPTLDFMRESYKTAIREGGEAIGQFKTKNLNLWLNQKATWIDDEDWQRRGLFIPHEKLTADGVRCFVGLDLASRKDLTALVKLFYFIDGTYYLVPHFWLPKDRMKKLSGVNKVNFKRWVKKGYITLTSGNITDYAEIERFILEEHEIYKFEAIAYDKFDATYLVTNLAAQGLEMYEYRQVYSWMNNPMKELQADVINTEENKIYHNNCPVLRWMVGNVVELRHTSGLVRPSKEDDKNKIDGIVAALMAKGTQITLTAEEQNNKTLTLPNDWEMIIV